MMRRSTAARLAGGTLSLIALTLFAGCHDKSQDANRENFTAAINGYLAQHGHMCLAKYDWPIYVTADDRANSSRDAIQMPVLEKLGLATGKDMQVERVDAAGKKIIAMARQYQL